MHTSWPYTISCTLLFGTSFVDAFYCVGAFIIPPTPFDRPRKSFFVDMFHAFCEMVSWWYACSCACSLSLCWYLVLPVLQVLYSLAAWFVLTGVVSDIFLIYAWCVLRLVLISLVFWIVFDWTPVSTVALAAVTLVLLVPLFLIVFSRLVVWRQGFVDLAPLPPPPELIDSVSVWMAKQRTAKHN